MNRAEKIRRPISKAGTLNRLDQDAGFTLLELVIVIFILGILALMIFPKISAFEVNKGKGITRHLSGLIQHLTQESAATKKTFRLQYDLDKSSYWVEVLQGNREFAPATGPLASGRKLPKGLLFEDVVTARHGKVSDGVAFTEFFPLGVEKTVIHLREGEQVWTLMVNALTGRVKVFDRYLEKQERETF